MAKRSPPAKLAPKARRAPAGPDAASVAEYVEFAGVVMERNGMPRIAGKMLGYLLVCEPPHQTQAQLVEALGASKGSVSTVTRQMEAMGVLERIRQPGERVDYLRIPAAGFTETMHRQWEARRQSMDQLTSRGLELLDGTPEARQQRLRSVRAFHAFMNEEMQAVIGRWLARIATPRPGPKSSRHSKKQAN